MLQSSLKVTHQLTYGVALIEPGGGGGIFAAWPRVYWLWGGMSAVRVFTGREMANSLLSSTTERASFTYICETVGGRFY
jgi:hypothetical protein